MLFVLAALLTVAVSSQAGATGVRILSMDGGEKFITVDDEAMIFTLPSKLTKYGSRAVLDYGGFSAGNVGLRMGFHYAFSDNTILGIYADNADWNVFENAAQATNILIATGGPFDGIDHTDNKAHLMFAHNFGSFRLGGILSIWADNQATVSPGNAQTDIGATEVDINIGAGFDIGTTGMLDFALKLGLFTFTDRHDEEDDPDPPDPANPQFINLRDQYIPDGMGMDIAITGRGEFGFFHDTRLIPYITLDYRKEGITHNYASYTDPNPPNAVFTPSGTYKRIYFAMGSDVKIEPFESVYIYPGLGMSYTMTTLEDTNYTPINNSSWLLPYFSFGLDIKLLKWLKYRFGAHQNMLFNKVGSKQAGTENDARDSTTQMTMSTGLGLEFDNLTMDFLLSNDLYHNGINLISGATTAPMNLQVAVKYVW